MGIRVQPQHLTITGALALALCLLALLAAGPERAYAQVEDYKPGEVIVRLDPGVDISTFLAKYSSFLEQRPLDEDLPYNLESRNIYLLKATPGTNLITFTENLLANEPLVDGIAEPNFLATAPEYLAGDARFRARVVSKYSSQANTTLNENLNLSCSREGFKGTRVAVLDTGAQLGHPRLEANFRKVKRYDFVDNDATPSDQRYYRNEAGESVRGQLAGHGTHVSGIVDRVAPGSKIMPLRVLDPDGIGDVYTVARAINFAMMDAHDVDVINLSLGSSEHSELIEEMVEKATAPGNDITVVAAAGNEDTEKPHYPAAGNYGILDLDGSLFADPTEDGLLAVTSVDRYEIKSDFATFGEWVDIAAPGEYIRSTYLRDKYAIWSGTSMATPFISGQAALVQAVKGPLTSAEIEQKIRSAASVDSDEFYAKNPEYDSIPLLKGRTLGEGHADVCGSLFSEP